MRWPNENAFDAIIAHAAAARKVPLALAKAVIAHESGFDPKARRAEAPRASLPPTKDFPKGGDESRGLYQLLTRTARDLGFHGDIAELYSPAVNVPLGLTLLGDALAQAKARGLGLEAALSQYNGGYRPELGFGKPAPRDLAICVGRDSAGKCIKTRNVKAGTYSNQDYVDAVMTKVRYFDSIAAAAAPAPAPNFANVQSGSSSTAPAPATLPAIADAIAAAAQSTPPAVKIVGGLATLLTLGRFWRIFS